MPIEWDKIQSKPTKEYKVIGQELLNFKQKIDEMTKIRAEESDFIKNLEKKVSEITTENKQKDEKINSLEIDLNEKNEKVSSLESELTEKNEKINSLEANISELNNTISTKDTELANLNENLSISNSKSSKVQNQVAEKESALAKLKSESQSALAKSKTETEDMRNQLEEILKDLETKENIIKEKEEEIASLNAKIEELKEQIPKKPVYEEAEETVKGAQCPKCGWPIQEEYKIVDGRRHLIRKYCPNTFCMWSSLEEPKKIITTGEAPIEEEKVLKVFRVIGSDIEEVASLEDNMVAIIADPTQNIVWIWRGKESSRFEYAEATGLANKVKKIAKIYNAHIERVDEESEPENFPKF